MGTVRLAKQIPALSLIKGNLSGVFIVNFKHISHLALVFLLLNHVISGWVDLVKNLSQSFLQ